ncbi:MAG: BatD family protein [Methylococcales bacterium]
MTLLVVSSRLLAAEISVDVDRKVIHANQSINIIFSADSATTNDPDFSPLTKDFDIVNQSSSSQLTMINGSVTRSYRWTISAIPKKTGKIIIPSIKFGTDKSPVSSLQVNDVPLQPSGQASGDVFLEVKATPEDPYVQAQVIYTVRVFHKVGISQASLSVPTAKNIVIEQLHEDREFRTRVGTQNYDVFERRYTIFPESSGKMVIPPIRLDAQVLTGQTTGGLFSRNITHSERFVSNAIELNVKPIPNSFKGKYWLPANKLELGQSWSEDPGKTKVGVPVTQTLTLQVEGLLKSQLPTLSKLRKNAISSTDIKTYPDQPKLTQAATEDGVTSRREEKIALIPGKSGTFKLPAVNIPWWNTQTDKMEIARIKAVTIQAKDSGNNAANPPVNLPTVKTPTAQTKVTEFNLSNQNQQNNTFWKWIALIAGLGWILTMLGVIYFFYSRRKKRSITQNSSESLEADSRRFKAGRNLRSACQNNNPVEARTALLLWAKARWSDNPPPNLIEIGKRLPPLQEQIDQLEQSLYKPSEKQWNGNMLWRQFKVHRRDNNTENNQPTKGLEPLFKA